MQFVESKRKYDVKLSNIIYEKLDKEFYQKETTNFKRITDKQTQIQGIDTIFTLNNKTYYCDEKAAIMWRNLNTYSLELSFINANGKVQDG